MCYVLFICFLFIGKTTPEKKLKFAEIRQKIIFEENNYFDEKKVFSEELEIFRKGSLS